MKKRVVVAMSGGVDSSVAAALLVEQGYEVIGMTMCFNLSESKGKRPACCGLEGIEDARRVAQALGIKHYVVNMQKSLADYVIKDFCDEYAHGRTPNPCVRCNQYLKFDVLLKKALALDADFIATGHYARLKIDRRLQTVDRRPKTNEQTYLLQKAKDKYKDQSYFLYRINKKYLKNILFPLGNYTKTEVRALARKFKLPVAEKPGSQEICFLPDNDYRAFLKNYFTIKTKPGRVVDLKGNVLGEHKGVAYYTIGQREGLGIACGYPVYVVKIDLKKNQLVVAQKEDAYNCEFLVKKLNFLGAPIKKRVAARVKIRYNHKESPAEIAPHKNRLKIKFKKAQFAITPGQSAVFYQNDTVFGGGIIEKVLD